MTEVKAEATSMVVEELPFLLPKEPALLILVGLPQSGKTTFANSTGYPVVCPNALRAALHGHAYISEAEDMVWTMARLMVKTIFYQGSQVVIFDACSNTVKRRSEWDFSIKINGIEGTIPTYYAVLDTPPEECIERAQFNDREDLIPIINRMHAEHEPLNSDELSRQVYPHNHLNEPMDTPWLRGALSKASEAIADVLEDVKGDAPVCPDCGGEDVGCPECQG